MIELIRIEQYCPSRYLEDSIEISAKGVDRRIIRPSDLPSISEELIEQFRDSQDVVFAVTRNINRDTEFANFISRQILFKFTGFSIFSSETDLGLDFNLENPEPVFSRWGNKFFKTTPEETTKLSLMYSGSYNQVVYMRDLSDQEIKPIALLAKNIIYEPRMQFMQEGIPWES